LGDPTATVLSFLDPIATLDWRVQYRSSPATINLNRLNGEAAFQAFWVPESHTPNSDLFQIPYLLSLAISKTMFVPFRTVFIPKPRGNKPAPRRSINPTLKA
jgi:hypothetical protein